MTPDMFPGTKPPRAKPRVLMHVSDASQVAFGKPEDFGKPLCQMRCSRCDAESDWLIFDTITEAKRGIPCEACNNPPTPGQPGQEDHMSMKKHDYTALDGELLKAIKSGKHYDG